MKDGGKNSVTVMFVSDRLQSGPSPSVNVVHLVNFEVSPDL